MRGPLVLPILAAVFSCEASADPRQRPTPGDGRVTESASVNGQSLSLDPTTCIATLFDTTGQPRHALRSLDSSGCRFVTDGHGAPQIVATARGSTVLVASFAPLPGSTQCDTRVRALVIGPDMLDLSVDEQRIRSCWRGPFDLKMFEILANKTTPSAAP
jgi:hypothetical protein